MSELKLKPLHMNCPHLRPSFRAPLVSMSVLTDSEVQVHTYDARLPQTASS